MTETRSNIGARIVHGDSSSVLTEPLFTATPPTIGDDEAIALVRRHYGVEATVTRLHSERDANFLVRSDAGKFIFKITNEAEAHGVTDFQTCVLLHLERTAPSLPVPRLVRTRSGEPATRVSIGAGSNAIRLLKYLDGTPLKELPREAHPLAAVGETLAHFDVALADFDHSCKKYRLLWDSSCLDQLGQLVRFVPDPDLARVCSEFVEYFQTNLKPSLTDLPWQVIHNDVNLNNVLVAGEPPRTVSGIFDFGDIIYAPRVNELAVACSYHICEAIPFDDALFKIVSSYNAVTPLKRAEIEALYDLIVARFMTTILITWWRATVFPNNRAYILRNNPPALEGLRIFRRAGRDRVVQILRRASNLE